MLKFLSRLYFFIFLSANILAQDLCPPAYLDATFSDKKIDLSWWQNNSFGDLLFNECFLNCSTAVEMMIIVHDSTICGSCSGGWFRGSDGVEGTCATGMYPCNDGDDDNYAAYASYSGIDSTTELNAPVDSRLIGTADLTNYSTAYIDFIETYSYYEDASHNNYLEISTDNGESWDSVYVSSPDSLADFIFFNTVDISEYAGSEIMYAFRYVCTLGYGETWFVDDIKVYGGSEQGGSTCGEFLNYKIYMDGNEIGETEELEFTVENLENDIEYCFEIMAIYSEGESTASFLTCATPRGPFQVNPTNLNFDLLSSGDYQELEMIIQNLDTLNANFSITSIELLNIELAQNLVLSNFDDGTLGDFSNVEGLGEEWSVGDSALTSSQYLPFPSPPDGGQFAYYNDDAAGSDPLNPATPMLYSNPAFSGENPSFLVFDLFFPNPRGPCEDGALYAEDFKVKVSVDDGVSWILIDSTMQTGVWHWGSYMYNLEPYISEANSFRVGFEYNDCGGEWAYGVAIDNMAIKMGDSFTWLTVSPYKGNISAYGGTNDSIPVKIGAYGVYDNFSITDELLIESGENIISTQIGVGIEVSVEDSKTLPMQFLLHQNYPNPFNPETNIRFDVAKNKHVNIIVYNLIGQKVATLLNKQMNVGSYNIKWNGLSDKGLALPSGIYFYEMKTLGFHSIHKLVLVK
jgi:hypothetical protein